MFNLDLFGLPLLIVFLGTIVYFSKYPLKPKERTPAESALRNFISSCFAFATMVGINAYFLGFFDYLSPVPDKINNFDELQKIIAAQSHQIENLKVLLLFSIVYFFILILPSVYNVLKELTTPKETRISFFDIEPTTNILGLREE